MEGLETRTLDELGFPPPYEDGRERVDGGEGDGKKMTKAKLVVEAKMVAKAGALDD
jgi:hypothetical protein